MLSHPTATQLMWTLIFLALSISLARADEDAERKAFFESKIRPVLVKHCYECHADGAEEIGGNLLLDHRQGMLKGGDSGTAILPGEPEKSVLIQALRYERSEMPPGAPLPETVIRDFEKWIKDGAYDPRSENQEKDAPPQLDQESLWSFYPRGDAKPPEMAESDCCLDPLDQFVLSRLKEKGMEPTQAASPERLIRRLYYDLIGLPPTFEQVQQFTHACKKNRNQAVSHLVDDLLSRPQFGERWGRHWLDVARYGESNGDDGLGRNATFPHAWRYRDYVIDALNRDVPYDRFIQEQIAGDLLPAENSSERNRNLIATGFLAIGSKPAKAMNNNFDMDIVDDQINVVSTTIMGLSVACARCHDHKHDPIPTRDYYALAGIFKSTETLYGKAANEKLTAPPTPLHTLWPAHVENQGSVNRKQTPVYPENYHEVVRKTEPVLHETLDEAPANLEVSETFSFDKSEFAETKGGFIRGKFPKATHSYSVSFWFKNNTGNSKRPITAYLFSNAPTGNKTLPGDHIGIGGSHDKSRTGKLFVFNGNEKKQSLPGTTVIPPGTWNHVVFIREKDQIKVFLNGADQPEIEGQLAATFAENLDFSFGQRSDQFSPLDGQLAQFSLYDRALTEMESHELHAASGQPKAVAPIGVAMGVKEREKVEDCKIHINGDGKKLGDVVPRGVLSAYQQTPVSQLLPNELKLEGKQSGRLQLAQWLTHPDHPQTARVMVNRIWLHLFGAGLVRTPDDFGVYEARPTHPELLDHLANRFINEGWSIKKLIRAIVLSRTYQLDSYSSPELIAADPDNLWLARHQRRRLDAEALRDSLLLASDQLDLSPGQGSAIEEIDQLINWPPGEATNLHRPSRQRSIYLCYLRHAPPPELAAFDLPTGVTVVGQRDQTILPTQSLFLLNNPFVIQQAEALAQKILSANDSAPAAAVTSLFHKVYQRSPSPIEINNALKLLTEIQLEYQATEAGNAIAWRTLCQALLAANEFRYID